MFLFLVRNKIEAKETEDIAIYKKEKKENKPQMSLVNSQTPSHTLAE